MLNETDIYKTTTGLTFAGLLAVCGFICRWIYNYVLKRDNDLKKVEKLIEKLQQRLDSIEEDLTVKKSDGTRVKLAEYVQDINHTLRNIDAGEAGAFQAILDKIDEKEKEDKGAMFEILKRLDKLGNEQTRL